MTLLPEGRSTKALLAVLLSINAPSREMSPRGAILHCGTVRGARDHEVAVFMELGRRLGA